MDAGQVGGWADDLRRPGGFAHSPGVRPSRPPLPPAPLLIHWVPVIVLLLKLVRSIPAPISKSFW